MSKNYMADRLCHEVLFSFSSDSNELDDSNSIRVNELRDSVLRRNSWFKRGYCLTSVKGRRRNKYYGIYKNSFSQQRNLLHEKGRTSLTGKKR